MKIKIFLDYFIAQSQKSMAYQCAQEHTPERPERNPITTATLGPKPSSFPAKTKEAAGCAVHCARGSVTESVIHYSFRRSAAGFREGP